MTEENNIENGVFLNPTNGNIIATGNVQANGIQVQSSESAMFGDQNLIQVISSYVDSKIDGLENEINLI